MLNHRIPILQASLIYCLGSIWTEGCGRIVKCFWLLDYYKQLIQKAYPVILERTLAVSVNLLRLLVVPWRHCWLSSTLKVVDPNKNASFSQAFQYLLDVTVLRRAYVNTRHWNFELSVWESLRSSNIFVQWVSAVGYKCTKKLVMTSWSWRCVPCGQKHLADKGFDDRSSRRVMWLLDIGPRIYPHSYDFRTKES